MIETSVIIFLLMMLIALFYRWTMKALLKQCEHISELDHRIIDLEFKYATMHEKLVTLEIAAAKQIYLEKGQFHKL